MIGTKKTGKVQTYEEQMTAKRLYELERRQKEAQEDDPRYEIDQFNKDNEQN